MKAKRQIESSLNSGTMLDGTGGHVSTKSPRGKPLARERGGMDSPTNLMGSCANRSGKHSIWSAVLRSVIALGVLLLAVGMFGSQSR
jgi:hypothetical protein